MICRGKCFLCKNILRASQCVTWISESDVGNAICEKEKSALLSIFGGSLTFQIPDIPSPQCWIHSHTKVEKGQAVKWTPSNWEQLIASVFVQWMLNRKIEKLNNIVSKLLWELFVRPWDLLVPQFDRKPTNKHCTWDLWEPLSGRLLGLGRPRPVVKAP